MGKIGRIVISALTTTAIVLVTLWALNKFTLTRNFIQAALA
jgi:hypothetical protein